MKKLVLFTYASTIDFVVAILILFGGCFLSLGTFDPKKYKILAAVIFSLTCILIVLYLLFTNTKVRSLGYILCGCEYSCEKGKWRIILSNLVYYALIICFIYTKNTVQFLSAILLLIDYIGFFIPGINNRFSVHLLGVNFSKRIVEKKDKICI